MSWDGQQRSEKYDSLDWINEANWMQLLIRAGDLRSKHTVCDLGTGTGVVAENVAPYCRRVIGIDPSKEMLDIATKTRSRDNIEYRLGTIDALAETADRIVARMTLHHAEDPFEFMQSCYEKLANHGKLIISEGIPPEGCEDWFKAMFELKEFRRTLSARNIVGFFVGAGFDVQDMILFSIKEISIRNWLDNSGLPPETQKAIFDFHVDAPEYVKRAYKMQFCGNDIIMSWRMAIVSGVKSENCRDS